MLSSTLALPATRHSRSYATERSRALQRRRIYLGWLLASAAVVTAGLAAVAL